MTYVPAGGWPGDRPPPNRKLYGCLVAAAVTVALTVAICLCGVLLL